MDEPDLAPVTFAHPRQRRQAGAEGRVRELLEKS